jgi:hypothetical protein
MKAVGHHRPRLVSIANVQTSESFLHRRPGPYQLKRQLRTANSKRAERSAGPVTTSNHALPDLTAGGQRSPSFPLVLRAATRPRTGCLRALRRQHADRTKLLQAGQ